MSISDFDASIDCIRPFGVSIEKALPGAYAELIGCEAKLHEFVRDGLGAPRVIYHTPDWEDFVHIACTEIRHCGASNVQVARRLRALLENLIVSLPPHRRPALEAERDRLDQAIRALYPIPADLALAGVPDSQGLGGSTGTRARG